MAEKLRKDESQWEETTHAESILYNRQKGLKPIYR